jgi:hypothetical protein
MSRLTILSVALIVAVVVPGFVASGVQAIPVTPPPLITSVIQTNAIPGNAGLVFITINGLRFGTGPVIVAAEFGYGGVDTVKSSTTPSLGICDIRGGVQQWNAGGKYTSSINVGHGCIVGGYNDVGVILNAWTSTQVVLGGFGGGIVKGGYNIIRGDTLVFVVFGPSNSGYSTYVTTYNGPSVVPA